jgi:hypothetical protein
MTNFYGNHKKVQQKGRKVNASATMVLRRKWAHSQEKYPSS